MPNNPTIAPTTQNYLGNITDLYKPSFMQELVLKHPGELEFQFNEILMMLGNWSPVDTTVVKHQEKDWTWDKIGVNANVGSPGLGNPITWRIPAAEHFNSGTAVYPRVGDVVMFPDAARTQGQVTDISGAASAKDITVEPLDDTTDTIPAVTAGDEIIIMYNAYGEATGQPDGRIGDLTTISHTLQRIKESFSVSGDELTNSIWVTVTDGQGKTMKCWYLSGINDARFRFMTMIDMAMLDGRGAFNNAATLGEDLMQGLIPFIENGGNVVNYPTGNFSLADLDLMIDNFTAEMLGRSKEYMFLGGLPIDRGFEDFIKDDLQEGVRYATFDNGGNRDRAKEVAINLGFKSMRRSRYTFHRRQFDEFDNPRRLAATNYPYPNWALCLPMGSSPTVKTQAGKQAPLVEMLYKAKGSYNRKFEHWYTGSADMKGHETSRIDEKVFDWRAQVGTRFKHAKAFGIFRP